MIYGLAQCQWGLVEYHDPAKNTMVRTDSDPCCTRLAIGQTTTGHYFCEVHIQRLLDLSVISAVCDWAAVSYYNEDLQLMVGGADPCSADATHVVEDITNGTTARLCRLHAEYILSKGIAHRQQESE